MFHIEEQTGVENRIVVLGVGGCGCNTIRQLESSTLPDCVALAAVNTDWKSLDCKQATRLQIGEATTAGLGAGAKPEVGEQAARESEAAIRSFIGKADIVFIAAGMGGGTGTGAAPVIAEIAAAEQIPVVAITTLPFGFEGNSRMASAEQGIQRLEANASAVLRLPNDSLARVLGARITLLNAFAESNRVLQDLLHGLSSTIAQSGLINIDMNDFKTVINHAGKAVMGVARRQDGETVESVVERALNNPLLDDVDMQSAQAAIVNIVAGESFELADYNLIGEVIQSQLSEMATVVIGLTIEPALEDAIEVMVIATGITDAATEQVCLPEASQHPGAESSASEPELLKLSDFLAGSDRQTASNQTQDDLSVPTWERLRNKRR